MSWTWIPQHALILQRTWFCTTQTGSEPLAYNKCHMYYLVYPTFGLIHFLSHFASLPPLSSAQKSLIILLFTKWNLHPSNPQSPENSCLRQYLPLHTIFSSVLLYFHKDCTPLPIQHVLCFLCFSSLIYTHPNLTHP